MKLKTLSKSVFKTDCILAETVCLVENWKLLVFNESSLNPVLRTTSILVSAPEYEFKETCNEEPEVSQVEQKKADSGSTVFNCRSETQ